MEKDKYNRTLLPAAGITGATSAASLGLAARLLYIIMYKNIGIGVLIIAPYMMAATAVGLSLLALSAVYLITELSGCKKRKGDLFIGGATGVTSLANLGFAAYLFCLTGGELGLFAPAFGSLLALGVAFAVLSTFNLTKALKDDKQVQSNVKDPTTQDTGTQTEIATDIL